MTKEEVDQIKLPEIWDENRCRAFKNLLLNEDVSLERIIRRVIGRHADKRYGGGNDISVDKVERDEYGTLVVKFFGGRNYYLSHNAPHYFTQLADLVLSAKNHGVRMWPISIKFDVPDDLYYATFGLAFDLDGNKAFILHESDELEAEFLVGPEAPPEDEEEEKEKEGDK